MGLNKKVRIIFLVIIMLTFLFSNFAGAESNNNEKATMLNKLSILQGDGSSFNLNSQLTRSEALTFIIRMMGQENNVLTNKNNYSVTPFSDVKKTDWYASAIGYGVEQKIVNGFSDGKFHPKDNISEKAFLKLVLGVLGYSIDTDFTWANLYAFAAQVGLVDPSYSLLTGDKDQYKREDVVNVLYTALGLNNKLTSNKIINILDPNHSILPELAPTPAPTPIPDALITLVTSTNVVSGTKVTVQFNENIKPIAATDIIVYETGNKTNKITTSIQSQTSNSLTLITANQKPNQGYVVEFTNVSDADGNQVNLVSSSFKGYVQQEVQSDFFKIKKVETVSKNKLIVYFTQPVNMNVEVPQYYEILKDGVSYVTGSFNNMSVKVLSSKEKAVIILLKNDLISANATYTIKISGNIISNYSVGLNDGSGDSMSFTANTSENIPFELSNLQPTDDKTISVSFTDELDQITATQLSNYSLLNASGIPVYITKATLTGDGDAASKIVKLQIAGSLLQSGSYELTIKDVSDKTKQNIIKEAKYPLINGGLTVRPDLKVLNVTAEDKSTLSLYFDQKLDPLSAMNISNYSINGNGFAGSIVKAYFNPSEPYKVRLFLNASKGLADGVTYNLTVLSSMLDELGKSSMANTSINFQGVGIEPVKPLIYDAKIIGKNTIKFITNVEILNASTNLIPSNYTLEYNDGTNVVSVQANNVSVLDGTTGILTFANLNLSKVYTLKFNSLVDYSNQIIRTISDGMNSHTVTVGG